MDETPGTGSPISTKLDQIAKLARKLADTPLTTLSRLVTSTSSWLRRSVSAHARKDGAVGVDGQSADEYARPTSRRNLGRLLERAKSGAYRGAARATCVHPRRGQWRAKTARHPDLRGQGAATCRRDDAGSGLRDGVFGRPRYGFRPSRSAHQALDALRKSMVRIAGGWVLEIDILKVLRHDRPRPTARFCVSGCAMECSCGSSASGSMRA